MADFDALTAPTGTTEQLFQLMMLERIEKLELQAAAREAAYPVPPTCEEFCIEKRDRGWFFGVQVLKAAWPTEPEQQDALMCKVLGELPFDAHMVATQEDCTEKLRTGLATVAMLKSAFSAAQRRAEGAAEASICVQVPMTAATDARGLSASVLIPQVLAVDGVITTRDPRCTAEHVGHAVEKAWDGLLMSRKDLELDLLLVREYGRRNMFELAYPTVWQDILRAPTGITYCKIAYFGPPHVSDGEDYIPERSRSQLVQAVQADHDILDELNTEIQGLVKSVLTAGLA